MPQILTGEAGNSGVQDFIANLRAGLGAAQDRRDAQRAEEAYQQRLQQGVQQVMLNDMRLQGMQAEQRANETFGELAGMMGDIQATGDPADAAFFDVAMNTQPEAANLWHRLAKDDPSLAMRFRDEFLTMAQRQMQAEQTQSFFEKAQKAEGTFLPEGWTQQAMEDIQSSGRSVTEKQREYVSAREKYGKAQAQGETNQGQLADLEAMLQIAEPKITDAEQRAELRSLRAQLMAEAEVDPGAPLDKNIYGRVMGVLAQAMAGGNENGDPGKVPVAGQPVGQQMLQPPPAEPTPAQDRTMGGQQYDPFGGVNAQGPQPTNGAAQNPAPAARVQLAVRLLLPGIEPGSTEVDEAQFRKATEGLTPEQIQEVMQTLAGQVMPQAEWVHDPGRAPAFQGPGWESPY